MSLWELYLTGSAFVVIMAAFAMAVLFIIDILEQKEHYGIEDFYAYLYIVIAFGAFFYLMRDLLF